MIVIVLAVEVNDVSEAHRLLHSRMQGRLVSKEADKPPTYFSNRAGSAKSTVCTHHYTYTGTPVPSILTNPAEQYRHLTRTALLERRVAEALGRPQKAQPRTRAWAFWC